MRTREEVEADRREDRDELARGLQAAWVSRQMHISLRFAYQNYIKKDVPPPAFWQALAQQLIEAPELDVAALLSRRSQP